MLPSCVGISPAGELLVGESARNQQLVYPERTVRSIKRKMGSTETVTLGDKRFTPQEISALILRELAEWASRELQQPVTRAVITVPAYFSDAQRNATREAGMMAGLEVMRILNEPTAASLAYGFAGGGRRTVMVYDLGGGTFDVSVVLVEGDVTEVLASHGNNRLGGDDFDDLLLEQLQGEFHKRHGVRIGAEHPLALARLWWAAEIAKKQLSFQPYAQIREEALITQNGKPLHLELELPRSEYEKMILPLVESTLDSVSRTRAKRRANWTRSCWWAGPRGRPWCRGCCATVSDWSRARTCIRICVSHWARVSWPHVWRAERWSAYWWMCRRIHSAPHTWGSAAAFRIRIVTIPSSAATPRFR
jgi:molecular chaperone DnaK (HSP70)